MNSATDKTSTHTHKRYIHNQMVYSHSWRVCLFVRSSNSAYWHFMHPCVICTDGWICICSDCVSIYMLWFLHTKLNAFAHVWTWTYRIYCKYEFKQPGDMCTMYTVWRKTDFCSVSFPNKIFFLSGPISKFAHWIKVYMEDLMEFDHLSLVIYGLMRLCHPFWHT